MNVQIKKVLKKKIRGNIGIGFLMFSDEDIIRDFQYGGKCYFMERMRRCIPTKGIRRLRMPTWRFELAPTQSDLIWHSLGVNEEFANLKTILLMVALTFFSIVVLSPIYLTNFV